MPTVRRIAAVAAGVTGLAVLALLAAAPALAHVSANAPGATQGGYNTVTVKVPTESDTASTTGLKVQLPVDNPIASVAIQPKTGWAYTVKTGKPATPLSSDDGPVTEIVTEIDWKAAAGNAGIKPGEFDTFVISADHQPGGRSGQRCVRVCFRVCFSAGVRNRSHQQRQLKGPVGRCLRRRISRAAARVSRPFLDPHCWQQGS